MKLNYKYRFSDNLLLYRNNLANVFGLTCILLFVFIIIFNTLININPVDDSTIQIIILSYFIVVFLSAIWAYKIAKRKNHYAGVWVLITIYSGPIGLLIISNMDYHLKNLTIKRIVKNIRKEYYEKIKNKDYNNLQTIKEYIGIIETKLNNEKTKEYENLSFLTIASEGSEVNQYINEKIKSIDAINSKLVNNEKLNWDPNWLKQENVCPACGTKLSTNSKICNECGLSIL